MTSRTGRYVRIQQVGDAILNLVEVQVWGATSTQRVNLAGGKSASQSSTLFGAEADLSNDGNPYTGPHTDGPEQAWWEVDLGTTDDISTIDLWNRTDCCFDRLSNFHLFVSDVPFAGTTVSSSVNQPGVSNWFFKDERAGHSVPVGRSGRYIRVQLTQPSYLTLMEAQVWSEESELHVNQEPSDNQANSTGASFE